MGTAATPPRLAGRRLQLAAEAPRVPRPPARARCPPGGRHRPRPARAGRGAQRPGEPLPRAAGSRPCWARPSSACSGADHAMARLARTVLASGLSAQESDLRIERRHDADALVDVAASPLFDDARRARTARCSCCATARSRSGSSSSRPSASASRRSGRWPTGLAHEIKNPLGGIRGAAELLARRAPRREGAARSAELIVRESTRIAALVDDLMVFARGDGPAAAHRQHPRGARRRARRCSRSTRWRRASAVERAYDPSLPEFLADPDRLTQVFLNLARNAMQAMEQGGGTLIGHDAA